MSTNEQAAANETERAERPCVQCGKRKDQHCLVSPHSYFLAPTDDQMLEHGHAYLPATEPVGPKSDPMFTLWPCVLETAVAELNEYARLSGRKVLPVTVSLTSIAMQLRAMRRSTLPSLDDGGIPSEPKATEHQHGPWCQYDGNGKPWSGVSPYCPASDEPPVPAAPKVERCAMEVSHPAGMFGVSAMVGLCGNDLPCADHPDAPPATHEGACHPIGVLSICHFCHPNAGPCDLCKADLEDVPPVASAEEDGPSGVAPHPDIIREMEPRTPSPRPGLNDGTFYPPGYVVPAAPTPNDTPACNGPIAHSMQLCNRYKGHPDQCLHCERCDQSEVVCRCPTPGEEADGTEGLIHASLTPHVARCGADYPNMRTTSVAANVTCHDCINRPVAEHYGNPDGYAAVPAITTITHDRHCCFARGCHQVCSHLCGTDLAATGCCATTPSETPDPPATPASDGEGLKTCPGECGLMPTVRWAREPQTAADRPLQVVLCGYCGWRGPERETREEAIAAWNRRSVPAPDLNRLAEEIHHCNECSAVRITWNGPGMCERHAANVASILQRHLGRSLTR